MENKRGQGVFLGVVAVATLIVAIIGATFAYFSASVTANGNVDVTAYSFAMTAEVELVSPTTDFGGLIPLNPAGEVGDTTNLLYAVNTGANVSGSEAVKCVDSNGHQVCALYKVTLTNNGTTSETLGISVKTTANDFADSDDLKLQMLTDTSGTKSLNGTAVTLPSTDNVETADSDESVLALSSSYNTTVGTGDNNTATLYFVVYLDDSEDADQSSSMGDTYSGSLVFTSGTGNKLTGTFNLSE